VTGDEVVTCGFTMYGDLGNGRIDTAEDLFVARYDRADGSYLDSEVLIGGDGPGTDVAYEVAAHQGGDVAVAAGVHVAAGDPIDGGGASVSEDNIAILLFSAEDIE
jgi:hypothetical protein